MFAAIKSDLNKIHDLTILEPLLTRQKYFPCISKHIFYLSTEASTSLM